MEWDEIKKSGDIFLVKEYMDNHPESENDGGIIAVYEQMRQKLLTEMKADPTRFSETFVRGCIEARILTREQMVSEGLATYNTFDKLAGNRGFLPDLAQCTSRPDLVAKEGCTDVYFLGIPGSGTTCLLMGLMRAENYDFTINYLERGGQYAASLRQYAEAGVMPRCTPGKYGTSINGRIVEKRKNQDVMHHVNFVEMSGDEFVHGIVGIVGGETPSSVAGIRGGSKALLSNSNKKVIFILVDPTIENVGYTHYQDIYDRGGHIIDMQPENVYINQRACLSKFLDWLDAEANKCLLKNVEAIHFIVTKADTLGETKEERNKKAYELLQDRYPALVQKLVSLCKKARLNRTTDGTPCIFTFSLGKFYLGNTFEYDSKDSLYLIDALRHMTQGTKETALRNMLGLRPAIIKSLSGDYGVKLCDL